MIQRRALVAVGLVATAAVLSLSPVVDKAHGVSLDRETMSADEAPDAQAQAVAAWCSSVYPSDWSPGLADAQGRFLQEFSYAGYQKGMPIPTDPPGTLYDVTLPPYNADNTGVNDATSAIQAAIRAAGGGGGGIVYLPAGTYRVKPHGTTDYALLIDQSHVVLRGAGVGRTLIYNDESDMRAKSVISVRPITGSVNWTTADEGNVVSVTSNKYAQHRQLPVSSVSGFNVGDWIVVRADTTKEWIDEHSMTSGWTTALRGVTFYRQITHIDPVNHTLNIDIPLRYWMKTRDNFRVYKIRPHLTEVGLEGFSIGMRQNDGDGTGDDDYNDEGTGAYDMHQSYTITMNHTVDGWINRVSSYRPASNTKDVQLLSNGIVLRYTRNVTIDNSYMAKSQYEGGGGNGYGFSLYAQENLIQNSKAYHMRHNFSFLQLVSSGNVLHNCIAKMGRYNVDFHMFLSMANLIDNMTVEGDQLEGRYRPHGTTLEHGHTTTQSVFWNTNGIRYRSGQSAIVESRQFGWGYVIGTRGTAAGVSTPRDRRGDNRYTDPVDFVEGIGAGASLTPQSLYLDQRNRRQRGPGGPPTFTCPPSAPRTCPGGHKCCETGPGGCRICVPSDAQCP